MPPEEESFVTELERRRALLLAKWPESNFRDTVIAVLDQMIAEAGAPATEPA